MLGTGHYKPVVVVNKEREHYLTVVVCCLPRVVGGCVLGSNSSAFGVSRAVELQPPVAAFSFVDHSLLVLLAPPPPSSAQQSQ
jgi:hypothetical protein